MIGQFFNSSSSSARRHVPSGDSAADEAHTRQLLYPDLHLPSPAIAHDGPLPEIDLEYPRDCRIIIAQDETPAMPKTILFDSKPPPPRVESPRAAGHGSSTTPAAPGLHARRSSLAGEPTPPRSPVVSGFTRARTRGSSISSMPNIDEHAQTQAKAQARAKESTDLANICLDCMFGNLAMNYRGNSNKIHIVPLDARATDTPTLPSAVDAPSSMGRAEGLRRRSNLVKSFTPANIPLDAIHSAASPSATKDPRRRTIFITRMFSVTLPEEEHTINTPTPQGSLSKGSGFPFPSTSNRPASNKAPYLTHVRKSPMYAITIILHLPVSHTSHTRRPSSRGGYSRNTTNISGMSPEHDSLGSSLDSDRRGGWAFIESNAGFEPFFPSSLHSDVDDRVDVVGQHWDVIMRALSSLQHTVQARILSHFKATDFVSSPVTHHHRHQSSRSSLRETSSQPARRPLRLLPNALMSDRELHNIADRTGHRVVTGMRIPKAMTGHGQWGLWREEARWLGRWAGRKEQNFFFFNLLTAFLGSHTEWLNILGPRWARKRHREQSKAIAGENLTISNRTIVVSPDKMAARRLVFLLAAFLPPSSSLVGEAANIMRPSTSASRAYSQSPPATMTPSRKQSLRRQINRRPRDKPSMSNIMLKIPGHGAGLDRTGLVSDEEREVVVPDPPGPQRPLGHSRRSSAHSVRSNLVISAMSEGAATSKSGLVTATPQSTIPIAQFTLPRTKPSGLVSDRRPDSSDSLASVNLINTLHRSGTGHTSTTSNESSNTSRWSSFMNFWSGRRASSTEQSDFMQTTDDGIDYRGRERPRSQLEQMVHELSTSNLAQHEIAKYVDGVFGDIDKEPLEESRLSPATGTLANAQLANGCSGLPMSAARPIPERPKTFDTELKLSVNEKDGVIEVDIPLPDFSSPMHSPLLGGQGSASSQHGSSFGDSSVLSLPYAEPQQSVNAAGWLRQFHPDFAVQAIKPYRELESDIKQAMSSEPTPLNSAMSPSLESGPQEQWINICSALIADTNTFTIRRIKLRRLVKLIPTPTYQPSAMTPGIPGIAPARSQYGNPYTANGSVPMMSEVHLAEEFTEEVIMDFDATLIDGVDRVLAQSGEVSRTNSVQSSRSSSRRGRSDARIDAEHVGFDEVSQNDCKGIIFGALEAIVKTVAAESHAQHEQADKPAEHDLQENIRPRTETDSSLREGIRRWLLEVQ